jgi:hypothetical protein
MNNASEIEIVVECGLVTSKSVAFGGCKPELHKASLEAIRDAVQKSPHRQTLRAWLESRKKLSMDVDFLLESNRASACDLDSLLSDLLNPLVEGACGPRPKGKPIPQTKDALFWRVCARKVQAMDEQIVIRIKEYDVHHSNGRHFLR